MICYGWKYVRLYVLVRTSQNLDDFFLKVLSGEIPSSHTLAAKITNVRKKYPELRPTEEQRKKKLEVKEQYINEYRNL